MDDATFEELLDRYGASIDRWPEPFRADAFALLSHSPSAARAVDEMRRVEATLRLSLGDSPTEASAIAARASRHRQWSRADRSVRRTAWGASAAAALAFGLFVGQATLPKPEDGADRFIAAALDLPAVPDAPDTIDVD